MVDREMCCLIKLQGWRKAMRQASVLLLNIWFIHVHDIEYDIELGVKRKFHCVKVFDIYQAAAASQNRAFPLAQEVDGMSSG